LRSSGCRRSWPGATLCPVSSSHPSASVASCTAYLSTATTRVRWVKCVTWLHVKSAEGVPARCKECSSRCRFEHMPTHDTSRMSSDAIVAKCVEQDYVGMSCSLWRGIVI
jgi:hypothetical protein